MTYKGTIRITQEGEASKSEGLYAYLDTAEETYRLYRDGVYPINDNFFAPFAGMAADVEGETSEQWLAAKSITVWCNAEGEEEKVPGNEHEEAVSGDDKEEREEIENKENNNNEDYEKDMQ